MSEAYTFWCRSSDETNRSGDAAGGYTFEMPMVQSLPRNASKFELTSIFRSVERDTAPNATIGLQIQLDGGTMCYNQSGAQRLLLSVMAPEAYADGSGGFNYYFQSKEVDYSSMTYKPADNHVTVTFFSVADGASYEMDHYVLALTFRPIYD